MSSEVLPTTPTERERDEETRRSVCERDLFLFVSEPEGAVESRLLITKKAWQELGSLFGARAAQEETERKGEGDKGRNRERDRERERARETERERERERERK